MSARRRKYGVIAGLWLMVLPAAALSDGTTDIYESISDAAIGPVFLTQAQREWLDRRRLLPPAPAAASSSSDTAAVSPAVKKKPAGYIVSSSGRRSDWSDGDFVSSTTANAAHKPFPGEIELVRHENDAADEQARDDDDESND